jgi:hypothetical protein
MQFETEGMTVQFCIGEPSPNDTYTFESGPGESWLTIIDTTVPAITVIFVKAGFEDSSSEYLIRVTAVGAALKA